MQEDKLSNSEQFLQDFNSHPSRKYDVFLACPENCEGYFTWHSCDVCGSSLGGERHPVVFYEKGTTVEVGKGDACGDCVVYIANGELPLD